MFSWFRCIIFIFLSVYALPLAAQDSILVNLFTQRIASLQKGKGDYPSEGNFPTFISNQPRLTKRVQDDNIFFASLINFTLDQYSSFLSESDRRTADSIQESSLSLYPKFKNKSGRLTYNFWRTDTAFVFPYTRWIRKLKKNTSLPDDMDDSVLSLLAQNADSARVAAAHHIMQFYTNKSRKATSIPKDYRQWKAYSVWYGKNFPPVMDVCVLSNILLFVQNYHLTWTAADSASLHVILQSVKSGDYIRKPLSVSPYYGSTSVILYHLSRLMSVENIPELDALKVELLVESVHRFSVTKDLTEKAMLASAIFKWGYIPPHIDMPASADIIKDVEQSNLPFFIGNVPSYFPSFPKSLFEQKKWLIFYHYCPAFNDTLLLEYLLLKRRFG